MQSAITDRLVQDHRNIERVLTLLRMQLDFMQARDEQGLTLLSAGTGYLIHYPGFMHHSLEELLFEAVVAKLPSAAGLQERMKKEHEQLAVMATNFMTRIGLQQLTLVPGFDSLRKTGIDYLSAYDDHIRFEEREIFPMALDTLSIEQWHEIRARRAHASDPLFGPESLMLYDNLYDALMGESKRLASHRAS